MHAALPSFETERGLIWLSLLGPNSRPTRLELEQFSTCCGRALPKVIIRLSKGRAKPDQGLEQVLGKGEQCHVGHAGVQAPRFVSYNKLEGDCDILQGMSLANGMWTKPHVGWIGPFVFRLG